MQADPITLSVDETNTDTPVSTAFTRVEELVNRSTYFGPNHAPNARCLLQLYRTAARPSGNLLGVTRSAFKITQDISVETADGAGTVKSPLIIEVTCSVPVGATAAETLVARQRALALLDRDDVMAPLNDTGII